MSVVIWKMDLEVLKRNGKHKTWGKPTTSNIVMQKIRLQAKYCLNSTVADCNGLQLPYVGNVF